MAWRLLIRSVFLCKIKEAFDKNPELSNLLLDPYFEQTIKTLVPAWRNVAATAIRCGVPVTGYVLGAELLRRAIRRRTCRPICCRHSATTSARIPTSAWTSRGGEFFHTNWTGHGGDVSATQYVV